MTDSLPLDDFTPSVSGSVPGKPRKPSKKSKKKQKKLSKKLKNTKKTCKKLRHKLRFLKEISQERERRMYVELQLQYIQLLLRLIAKGQLRSIPPQELLQLLPPVEASDDDAR